ncbi:MAG TPA: hypothetical protein PKD86_18950, partial [Gemmatales bacterium]|nr:hypothetical protein [Gemmatales bacterium]
EERFESCEERSQALDLCLAPQPPLPPPLPTVVLPALPSPNEVTPLGIDVNGTSATTIPDLLASGKKVEPWLSPEVRQWAEAGYAPAQNYFARCLRQGVGVPRDPMQAVWGFVAAPEQGPLAPGRRRSRLSTGPAARGAVPGPGSGGAA